MADIHSENFGNYFITFLTTKPKNKKITTVKITRKPYVTPSILQPLPEQINKLAEQQDNIILQHLNYTIHSETKNQIDPLIDNTKNLLSQYSQISNPKKEETTQVIETITKINQKLNEIYLTVKNNTMNRMSADLFQTIDLNLNKPTINVKETQNQLELL